MGNITPDFFIEPNVDINEDSEDIKTVVNLTADRLRKRWETQAGQKILDTWKANHFSRETLDSLVGRYYGQTDVRGIPLKGEILENIDLSKADLYAADLEGTRFERANLEDSWLSHANIKGTQFNWVTMDKVLIDGVEFDTKTSFLGVNLNEINFTLAILIQDLAIGQQRIIHLKKVHPLFSWFLKISCDYGRSFSRFLSWVVAFIFTFGLLYHFIPGAISHSGFLNSIYFSIVTFTSLGYGDILPTSIYGKFLVILEVIIGYLMLGLLVAILSRRVIGN